MNQSIYRYKNDSVYGKNRGHPVLLPSSSVVETFKSGFSFCFLLFWWDNWSDQSLRNFNINCNCYLSIVRFLYIWSSLRLVKCDCLSFYFVTVAIVAFHFEYLLVGGFFSIQFPMESYVLIISFFSSALIINTVIITYLL